jgi:L-seryl-tRNA(Ser) seleniumtransferase
MGTEPSDPSVGDTDEDEATTQPEPTVKQVLAQGCDLVTLSGDKLLGGPQAGILCGKAELIAKLARHPLLRALRPDKLQLAALGATLELYRDGLCSELPTWRMLHQTEDTLRARAERLQQLLTVAAVSTDVLRVRSAVGGGAQPLHKPWSYAVSPQLPPCELLAVQSALRRHSPPVVARVARQRLLCDVRTISDAQLPDVARALRAAIRR